MEAPIISQRLSVDESPKCQERATGSTPDHHVRPVDRNGTFSTTTPSGIFGTEPSDPHPTFSSAGDFSERRDKKLPFSESSSSSDSDGERGFEETIESDKPVTLVADRPVEQTAPPARMESRQNSDDAENEAINSETPRSILDEQNHPYLPSFPSPAASMWISSYEANAPSEDRTSSLVNLLLQPDQTQDPNALLRVSMWAVLDGHGGGAVASYASDVILPHIAASICRSLGCTVYSKGDFTVNEQPKDVTEVDYGNFLKLGFLSRVGVMHAVAPPSRYQNTSLTGRKRGRDLSFGASDSEEEDCRVSAINPHTINYRSPELIGEVDGECDDDYHDRDLEDEKDGMSGLETPPICPEPCDIVCNKESEMIDRNVTTKIGLHTPSEVDIIKNTLENSFLQVDEGWINSINSKIKQSSCVAGGKWNAGSCALVTCMIQRIDTSHNIDGVRKTHDAMLYTAHCGDCRAVLGTSSQEDPHLDRPDIYNLDATCGTDTSSDCDNSSDCESSDDDDDNDFDNSQRGICGPAHPCMQYLSRPVKRICLSLNKNTPSSQSSFLPLSQNPSDRRSNPTAKTNESKKRRLPPLPPNLRAIDLTLDHSAYNLAEAALVRRRTNDAPRAISRATSGGIKRVAGSLAVTRALGDAYLKTPELSFPPYRQHVPYITARPEISTRRVGRIDGTPGDRILVMASDGVWDTSGGNAVMRWVKKAYEKNRVDSVSSAIVRQVLKKVCRARNPMTLGELMALPRGKCRRNKHDDITACVVDIGGFFS